MRLKLLKLVTFLLLAGAGESRPQNFAPQEVVGNGWKPISVGSEDVSHTVLRNSRLPTSDSQRQLKDLQYMDQSLRTVATQLLNVTSPEEVLKTGEKQPTSDVMTKLIFVDSPEKEAEEETQDSSAIVKAIDSQNFEANSSKYVPQERPVNSKFGFLEISHPGEAMALTEEELEKEMHSIKHPNHKVQPTTTGGISTWILLNPPSTTTDLPLEDEETTKYTSGDEGQFIVKTTSTIQKVETDQKKPTASVEKVTPQSNVAFEKINTQVPKKSTPNLIRKSTTPSTPKVDKLVTKVDKVTSKVTQQPDKSTKSPEKTTQFKKQPTTPKSVPKSTTEASTFEDKETGAVTPKTVNTTKKVPPTPRTSVKPKPTNAAQNNKNSTVAKNSSAKNSTTKAPKPQNRPKPTPQRKLTTKSEAQKVENSPTPKIEKVTLKPVPVITSQGHLEVTNVPMFVTKIKASVFTETKKAAELSTAKPTTKVVQATTSTKPSPMKEDIIEAPTKTKPSGNKANNVLKVQLKRPVDDLTKIEIEPIRVNAPVLKIEKVEKEVSKDTKKDQDLLTNSKIDVKFDFNPELTKIKVETPDKPSSTTKSPSKRRQSNKRKKNKNKTRRRKPSSTEGTDSALSALSSLAEVLNISEATSAENAIQESKIEPETKVANATKSIKKKQVQKPISTQIYNFLSREVMPSFGVMSLVGLGLGLASYFLYPFGGSIARRNYDLEPNYKYNLDEYGGNYGQNEEEVFSKVLQGMTKHDNKYGGIKDYGDNYYKYHHYDGPYSTTTRKPDQRQSTVSGPIYRPVDNSYDVNYRNTEFKYPELPTTPNYYERQKQKDFAAGKEGNGNRQFVVGNIPKEYAAEEKGSALPVASKRADYENTDGPSKFEREMAQNFNFPKNSVNIPQAYTQVEPQKNEEVYEEIEITPTAVAVEHGPRLLRNRRSKRESVIQLIPSKSEIEKEHREEEVPLSNEIFDIIDSAIPVGGEDPRKETEKERMKEKMKEEEIKKKIEEKDVEKNEIVRPQGTTVSSSVETSKHSTTANVETTKSETTSSSWKIKSSTHSSVRTDETTTEDWFNDDLTTEKPKPEEPEGFSVFSIVKKIAEIKIKLGLTLLKHASEGFARYLGHVQKKFNGEE